jgi:hypothetical protein
LVGSEKGLSIGRADDRPIFGKLPTNPGPGTYTPVEVEDRLPIAISKTGRMKFVEGGPVPTLGPEPWVTPAADASAAFRAMSPRNPFPKVEETPAPVAYYRPKRERFEPGVGLGYRADRTFGAPLTDGPGPGAYEARVRWIRTRKSALDRAIPDPINRKSYVPGPGTYQLRATWGGENSRAHSVFVSRTVRKELEPEEGPAPDAYRPKILDPVGKVPPSIHEARFAKFGDWVDYSKAEVPPPDSYQEVTIAPGKGMTFSRIGREVIEKDGFPGPGHYDVLHRPFYVRSLNARAIQASEM